MEAESQNTSTGPLEFQHSIMQGAAPQEQPEDAGAADKEQLAGRKRTHEEMAPDSDASPAVAASVSMAPMSMMQPENFMPLPTHAVASGQHTAGISSRPSASISAADAARSNKRDLNWDLQYDALVAFANTYGHCNVRSGYSADTDDRAQINLYAWLALQRRHKKVGRLRKDREERLQLLVDMGKLSWVGADNKGEDEDLVQPPPPPPPSWNSYFGALLVFAEDHGHANVPTGHMSFIERRRCLDLGAWVRLQRQMMANGKLQDNLREKMNILVQAGIFSWTAPSVPVPSLPESVLEANWNLQFDAVAEYANAHGHCNVTDHGTTLMTSFGTSFDLGMWVLCQRVRYKLRNLPPSRIERLAGLIEKGFFAWRSPEEARARAEEKDKKMKEEDTLWNAWYNVLVWYGRHNGHCNLGATDTVSLPDESEAELGKWLDIQKRYLFKSKLKPDRAEKLKRLVDEQKLPAEWITEYPQLSSVGIRPAQIVSEHPPPSEEATPQSTADHETAAAVEEDAQPDAPDEAPAAV